MAELVVIFILNNVESSLFTTGCLLVAVKSKFGYVL